MKKAGLFSLEPQAKFSRNDAMGRLLKVSYFTLNTLTVTCLFLNVFLEGFEIAFADGEYLIAHPNDHVPSPWPTFVLSQSIFIFGVIVLFVVPSVLLKRRGRLSIATAWAVLPYIAVATILALMAKRVL